MKTPKDLSKLKQVNMQYMGYTPMESQTRVHNSTASVILVSGGEGSGKSCVTGSEIAARFGLWRSVLLVCYKSKSAVNEADYLYTYLNQMGAVREYRKPEGGNISLVTKDDRTVESVSVHTEGARAVTGTGKSYDIIAMVEAGKQKYEVFLACLIRIQRSGGLLILSGTIEKSEPWFPDLISRLQSQNELNADVVIMPTWDNRIDYPLGRQDPKILALEKELPPDLFMERLGGKPAPLSSLVLKEFSYLTHVFEWARYDPAQTVEAWIDYGYSGSHYSIAFVQFHPRAYTRQFKADLLDAPVMDVFVIGDLYLDHAIHEEAIEQCKQLPWWNHVQGGVGDVVGKTHPQAGQSPFDVWRSKANIVLRGEYILVQDNVDRHRTFLRDPNSKQPRIFFNPACKGIREYGLWKRKEIGENLYGDPETKNCDLLKALGYGLIDHFGRVDSLHNPQSIAFGERPLFADMQNRLPSSVAIPGLTAPQPVPAFVSQSNTGYAVVPRAPKRIG